MSLDLPTLMVMQSFALASAGAVLFLAWLQSRIVSALGIWAVANLLAAGGILSLMLGFTTDQPVWLGLGFVLLCSQSGLIWKAALNIDSKHAPLMYALLGPMLVGVGGAIPGIREFDETLALTIDAAYILAAAASLWLGRKELLAARWPLIILTGVHGTALLIGSYSTFSGSTGRFQVPALASLFGFIYFESTIFAVGTSIFVLAFIKERNEAASLTVARTDSLTGIANRAAFLASAERILERFRRDAAPVSAMMFDLDRFKAVNDMHGHAIGDAVIKKFCEVAGSALRPNDLFGRLGGEEFAVLLPGSSIEAAYARADRIRISFAESCRVVRDHPVNATVSGGVSVSSNAEMTLDALLEDADAALYGAKTEGRNRINRSELAPHRGPISNVYRVA